MKTAFLSRLFLGSLITTSVISCQKDDHKPNGNLEGTWQLANRQCYCVPAPTPNETVIFSATEFAFYSNGLLTGRGAFLYDVLQSFCGDNARHPALRFAFSSGSQDFRKAAYAVSNDTLVLNYGGPCDAPVDTYVRMK